MEDLHSILASLHQIESDITSTHETHADTHEIGADGALADVLVDARMPWESKFGEFEFGDNGAKFNKETWNKLTDTQTEIEFVKISSKAIQLTLVEVLACQKLFFDAMESYKTNYGDLFHDLYRDTTVLLREREDKHVAYQDALKNEEGTQQTREDTKAAYEVVQKKAADIVPKQLQQIQLMQENELLITNTHAKFEQEYNKLKTIYIRVTNTLQRMKDFPPDVFERTQKELLAEYEGHEKKISDLHTTCRELLEEHKKNITSARKEYWNLAIAQSQKKEETASKEDIALETQARSRDIIHKQELPMKNLVSTIRKLIEARNDNIIAYGLDVQEFVNIVEYGIHNKDVSTNEATFTTWAQQCDTKKYVFVASRAMIEHLNVQIRKDIDSLGRLKDGYILTCSDAKMDQDNINARIKKICPHDFTAMLSRLLYDQVAEKAATAEQKFLTTRARFAALIDTANTAGHRHALQLFEQEITEMTELRANFNTLNDAHLRQVRTVVGQLRKYLDLIRQLISIDKTADEVSFLDIRNEMLKCQTVYENEQKDREIVEGESFRIKQRFQEIRKKALNRPPTHDGKRYKGEEMKRYKTLMDTIARIQLSTTKALTDAFGVLQQMLRELATARPQADALIKKHASRLPHAPPAQRQPGLDAPAVKEERPAVKHAGADPPFHRSSSVPATLQPYLKVEDVHIPPPPSLMRGDHSAGSGPRKAYWSALDGPGAPGAPDAPFSPDSPDAPDDIFSHRHSQFEVGITALARCLLYNLYPPVPAPPFHERPAFARYAQKDPRVALAAGHPELHALCARITHIAGPVLYHLKHFAAYRFLVEFPLLACIVSRALEPGAVARLYAARRDVLLAPDVGRIRACLDRANLPLLRQLALAQLPQGHFQPPPGQDESDAVAYAWARFPESRHSSEQSSQHHGGTQFSSRHNQQRSALPEQRAREQHVFRQNQQHSASPEEDAHRHEFSRGHSQQYSALPEQRAHNQHVLQHHRAQMRGSPHEQRYQQHSALHEQRARKQHVLQHNHAQVRGSQQEQKPQVKSEEV